MTPKEHLLGVFVHPAGALTQATLVTYAQALESCSSQWHGIVLVNLGVVFPAFDDSAQEPTWLVEAGRYRAAQEQFKLDGGWLGSVVTHTLLGGTYLIHGMAATTRWAISPLTIYPGLPVEPFERIFKQSYPHPTDVDAALRHGLITQCLPSWESVPNHLDSAYEMDKKKEDKLF